MMMSSACRLILLLVCLRVYLTIYQCRQYLYISRVSWLVGERLLAVQRQWRVVQSVGCSLRATLAKIKIPFFKSLSFSYTHITCRFVHAFVGHFNPSY